ncbi:hypothetical protein BDV37DRAFT_251893 [Aspergillus pseudonomiae]|uniref:Uncharacterized protein n=1 Tax=Aspergillus pseudonomiae TaxID=1506151 RepID=A0A5N7D8V9_9EURO|nr:uncharacterized protein BDV37DRAFT_251893 [Aspergillus pseudonomiae]KAE8402734.1 hypothetical protein BDV37DRAFT_251893 [Aspergillus pseudonomiae]
MFPICLHIHVPMQIRLYETINSVSFFFPFRMRELANNSLRSHSQRPVKAILVLVIATITFWLELCRRVGFVIIGTYG